ncbi:MULTISPECIES: hypothetical protein [Streptomyces]|uniref:EF-hand domain-containing protein n=1 Tax=Streptomyces californicus TaxID=67351 RepID=A0ABD7D0Q8_9ACTN|nr:MULTISPECIES: hypothetical protein [Streptomyces]MBK0375035.1 hypothetical protein [Streptomyces sp. RB110-1]MBK0388595.1 hypothetical protein [Streptomyces sp. RB110-2]MCF3169138.1 hypothetical protein [Streptomyces violaceoruber]MDP9951456.1 hypothetical protein [Streptomyces sp. DSM 41269]MDW4902579.1 hypothetical protein [Streptomyces californicus]
MSPPQITQLFRWRHRLNGQAYSLLRAVYDPNTGHAVAVVSELADSPAHGITYDFADVADAALPLLRANLSPHLASLLWIAHFGDFSSHDPGGPETFTAIALKVEGDGYRDDDQGDRRLTADEVTRLFHGRPLAPVPDVLAGLEPLT